MYTKPMFLADKLYNHIALQDAAMRLDDAYGIEVELEGQNILKAPLAVLEWWGQHPDNSLRQLKEGDQCIEYVSKQPYSMQHTEKAINVLFGFLNSTGVKVYDSYRTSIHVHVNFGRELYRTVYNFMTIALLMDELLVSQNGDHRIGNNFCLRAKDALGQVTQLIQSIETGHNFFNIIQNERYSSINFASLLKFGSVEFRSLECTTHEGRVLHWINTLARMKAAARDFENPVAVISAFSKLGPHQFLREILGPYAMKYLSVPGMESMLINGMRIAQDLAYCSAWKEKDKSR